MNSVMTPRRPQSASAASVTLVVAGLLIALGVAVPVARLGAGEPRQFRRLTVQNPTPYIVNVEVARVGEDTWLDVGSFRRDTRRPVDEVADQGARWVFRFSYGGVEAGELAVSRAQMARDRWTVTVPTEVADRLRVAGMPESAR